MDAYTPTRSARRASHVTPERTGSSQDDSMDVEDITLPTPHIQRLADVELRERLRDAYRLLREKDHNLRLAAELGQQLLEANTKLKQEYEATLLKTFEQQAKLERLLANSKDHGTEDLGSMSITEALALERQMHQRANERVDELNKALFELERQRQEWEQQQREEQEARKELEAQSLRERQRLQKALDEARQELKSMREHINEVENDRRRLATERAGLLRDLRAERGRDEQLEAERQRFKQLERELGMVRHARDELERQLKSEREQCAMLSDRLKQYDDTEKKYQALREKHQQLEQRYTELSQQFEATEERARDLATRLSALEAAPEDGSHSRAGVTLLSEVEDRRRLLETHHQRLAEQHRGLLKAHQAAMQQQSRMRSHISRLTQLTQTTDQEEQLRRLEEVLDQTRSENQELQMRLERLERAQDQALASTALRPPHALAQMNAGETADAEVLEWLRLRVQQLTEDAEAIRRELRTVKLLKAAESEKVRDLTKRLGEMTVAEKRTKANMVQLQFALEDVQMRIEHFSRIYRRHLEQLDTPSVAVSNKTYAEQTTPLAHPELLEALSRLESSRSENATMYASSSSSSHTIKSAGPKTENTSFEKPASNVGQQEHTTDDQVMEDAENPFLVSETTESALHYDRPRENRSTETHSTRPDTTMDTTSRAAPKQIYVRRENIRSARENECQQQ
jgi:hypothetical protein